MHAFLSRRLLQAALVVFLATTGTFVLIHLAPGDPFTTALENPNVSGAMRAQWRAAYGLDRPLGEQYLRWLGNAVRGDFGWSFSLHRPVGEALALALPNTLVLVGTALLLSFTIGVCVGVVQAARRGRAVDRVLGAVALLFYSLPDFWLAIAALLAFAYWLPVFPPGGVVDPIMHDYMGAAARVGDRLYHLALPAAVLAALSAAVVARFQRAALLDVAHADYLRTARAKGVPESRIALRHALRNALIPTITLVGLAFPALFGGALFIERVFSWPGMGLLAMNAIATRDYPLVIGSVIVGATTVAAGGLLADLCHVAADPRLRDR